MANIQFQYVGVDRSSKPINDTAAISPMIRIGAYPFGGLAAFFCAGTTFGPPPNGGTGAGDVFFNTNVGYQMARGAEGSRLQDFPVGGGLYMTDVYGLALHEIGHAIGLGGSTHSDAVMCDGPGSTVLAPAYKRGGLSPDDIAGAQFLYGVAPSSRDSEPTR